MCTAKKALDDPWFSTDALDAIAEFGPQMRQIQAAHVAQLDSLQLGPEALARIQFRGIRRQALQMDALRRAVREELGGRRRQN